MSTPAPDAVKRLVDHFDQNRDAYLSGSYNEAQLRREFIDPLFETLGWDIDNKQGLSETSVIANSVHRAYRKIKFTFPGIPSGPIRAWACRIVVRSCSSIARGPRAA
ncbi:MAG: type I restriction enzyme HsdR N-terminal domain-containing protein [candidate division WOR-3 bacterium]|nr:type I restriction enzyme HsdR N-terminal domain-containing protein [candidate division WOR-3 bacterium]